MLSESSNQYPTLIDDGESASEVETKTKMAFAKMQVPLDLKSSYLLTEDELTIKLTDIEDEEMENNEEKDTLQDVLRVGGALDGDTSLEPPIVSVSLPSGLIRRTNSTKAPSERDMKGLKSKYGSKRVMSQKDLQELKRSNSKELYNNKSSNSLLRSVSPVKHLNKNNSVSNNRSSWPMNGDDSIGKLSNNDDMSSNTGKKNKSSKAIQLGLYA
jgi:hypothetical protein